MAESPAIGSLREEENGAAVRGRALLNSLLERERPTTVASPGETLTHGRTRPHDFSSQAEASSGRFLDELSRVQGRLEARMGASESHMQRRQASVSISPGHEPPVFRGTTLSPAQDRTASARLPGAASAIAVATSLRQHAATPASLSHPTVAALVQREREIVLEEFRRELAQMDHERTEWRTKEMEQMRVVQACLLERDALKRSELQREQELITFKEEISQAVETLTLERQRWNEAAKTKDDQVAELQQSFDRLTIDLNDERQQRLHLEQEADRISADLVSWP